ncbi:MAG: hypothetical protein KAY32_10385 [Candidatus Eisenbacteria sp.]|nr:hypothetical protein [Candidatus Eisenbacteria bacterium]
MAGKKKWKFAEFEDPKLTTVAQALQMNRTMYVDQFSEDPDFENQLIEVRDTSELFEKVPAKASVEFDKLDGDMEDAELHFKRISDFNRDNTILMLDALREQAETADLLEHFLKLFGKGGKWKQVFEDAATREGFKQRLDAVLNLLESTES